MGLKNDLIIGGVIIAGIVIFKDKIASGLAGAGGALGEGVAGLGTSFFDALRGAIPTQEITTNAGIITAPENLPVNQSTQEEQQVTTIGEKNEFIAVSGSGTLEEQAKILDENTIEQGPSLLEQFTQLFGGFLGGPISGFVIPQAFGETEQQFQGPPAPLDPNRPLTLDQFAKATGITEAEAFKLQKNNPDLFDEISGSIFDPFSQQSFESGGVSTVGPQSFSIINNKPLSDIINQFKQLGFNLTASQAEDIKAQLDPNDEKFQNFDFGSNTGSALELREGNFGQQAIEGVSINLELQKAIEAAIASSNKVFGGTSNFANPNFPITLGEAFLGKKGTVVSNSIANLNDEQLAQFIEQFGEA